MNMQPDFEKANEIYFRLGIIYKQQQKYEQSLEVHTQPRLLTSIPNNSKVLQVYRPESSQAADRRGYLVSNRSRSRTAQRRTYIVL